MGESVKGRDPIAFFDKQTCVSGKVPNLEPPWPQISGHGTRHDTKVSTPNRGGREAPPQATPPDRGATGRRTRGPEAPRAAPPSQERAARRRPQPDRKGAPPGDPDPEREGERGERTK